MLVSSTLSIGQATFILRILIQGLFFGGLFLLGYIIFAHAPRIGAAQTHDVLNRLAGQITTTVSSAKWLFWRTAGKSKGHPPSHGLTLAIALFLFYAIFVSISDIGFIGFHSCTIPYPDRIDFPASVKSDQDALETIQSILVNPIDLPLGKHFRCDSSEVFTEGPNVTLTACNAWKNSTYDDPTAFRDLNTTDSDSLMPRRLLVPDKKEGFYMNYIVRHIEGARTTIPTIANGISVVPHASGVRAVFGVPKLSANESVYLPKTLAVEADVGCMSTGILSEKDMLLVLTGETTFLNVSTSEGWRTYSGPDYLRDALTRSVDKLREYVKPMFTETSTDGSLYTLNTTFTNIFNPYDSVSNYHFPSLLPDEYEDSVLGNCSQDIVRQLGIPTPPKARKAYPSYCNLLQVSASLINTTIKSGLRKLICATTTNLTMVSATLRADSNGTISMDITRLPSILNTVYADYWQLQTNVSGFDPGTLVYDWSDEVLRYTLSDDPNGQVTHPILQDAVGIDSNSMVGGAGSPGHVFSKLGNRMLKVGLTTETQLGLLNNEFYSGNLSPARVTRWAGEMGASFLLGSLAYNGWVARNSPALTVISSGGKPAACFKPPYGLAFLPLLLAATIILIWTIVTLVKAPLKLHNQLKEMYGGLAPCRGAIVPTALSPDSVLIWEKGTRVHLQALQDDDEEVVGDARVETLVEFVENSESKFLT